MPNTSDYGWAFIHPIFGQAQARGPCSGNDGAIQFQTSLNGGPDDNSVGVGSGSANFTYNPVTNMFTAPNATFTGDVDVKGNLTVTGTLHAKVDDFVVLASTITMGDAAADTVTFNAATASIPNDLNINGGHFFLDQSTKQIGIGTITPDASYVVELEVADSVNKGGLLIDSNETGVHYALHVDSESSLYAAKFSGAGVHIQSDITNTSGLYVNNTQAEAGSSPLVTFAHEHTSNTQTTLVVRQHGTGDIINVFDGSTEIFTVLDGGNVGIGVVDPDTPLEILSTADQLKLSYDSDSFATLGVDSDGDLNISAPNNNADITFTVDDAGSDITALTIEGANYGSAVFTPADGGYLNVDDAGTDGHVSLRGNGGINLYRNINSAATAPYLTFSRSRVDGSNNEIECSDGDSLGFIKFSGHDNDYEESARIEIKADGGHESSGDLSDTPGRIEFSTTPDGEAAVVTRMTIKGDGNIGIGTGTPKAKLTVDGGVAFKIRTETSDVTVTVSDYTIISNNADGSATITLPTANTCAAGQAFVLKNIHADNVTVNLATASDKLESVANGTALLPQLNSITIICDGTDDYYIV